MAGLLFNQNDKDKDNKNETVSPMPGTSPSKPAPALSLSADNNLRPNPAFQQSPPQPKPLQPFQQLPQQQSKPQQQQPRVLPEMRSFGDVTETRRMIFDRIRNAASSLRPVENQRYALTLGDVHYAESEDPTPDEVKRAILEGGSVVKTLRGTWTLTDKMLGKTSSRKTVVAKVPYMLDNGTFLRNGTKYVIRNQSRLLPGAYVKKKENGESEVHINADMREGSIHHYGIDQETGQLNVHVAGSKTPIFALAKALGATEEEMRNAWGDALYDINRKKFSPTHIAKLHEKMTRGTKKAKDDNERLEELRESLERINFDPEVMQATLGKPYAHLNKDVLLDATKKLIAVSRGDVEPDDRDHTAFQEVWGPEDIFEERISKDSGSFRRQLLNSLTYRYGGDIAKLPAGALTKQLDSAILSSGLGGNPEEINSLEIFDKAYSLTKLGAGGLTSIESAPDESRNVHPSQRGFIDPSRTPESTRIGIDTYLANATRKGSDRQLYSNVVDLEGKEHWLRPKDLLTKTVAVASEFRKAGEDDFIPVLRNGKEDIVSKNEVDYLIPHFENVFSPLANLVPFKSAAQGNRVAMGSRMLAQAMPLTGGEAPYVQTGFPDKPDWSYYKEFGKNAGAVFADQPGTVLEATERHVLIENADGTKKKINLQRYLPSNRKSYVNQVPAVSVGQRVDSGSLLVKSNMTDDKGQIALGRNARVVMIPWRGMNFEDGMLVSQSFADKMRSQHMYQNRIDWSPEYKRGKHAFMGIFPSTFDKRQLNQMDENGVATAGTVLKKGDPIILAARSTEGGKKSKKSNRRLFSDASLLWEHHDDGVVTDVYHSDKGTSVLVKMESPMREGDKICYDEETEVLTTEGWKPIADVTLLDRVACLVNDTLVYQNPTEIHQYPRGGRMYRIGSQQIDLLVTDKHQMYVQRRNRKEFKLEPAEDIYGKRVSYKKDAKWIGEHPVSIILPAIKIKAGQYGHGESELDDLTISSEIYFMLLGAYLSDGNLINQPKYGNYGISIVAMNSRKREALLDALSKTTIGYSNGSHDEKIVIYSKQLMQHFSQFGTTSKTKRIIPSIFKYSRDLLQILFDWLMWGDGTTVNSLPVCYTTMSKGLADDVQRLCLHIGKAANINIDYREEHKAFGRVYHNVTRYDVRIINSKLTPTVNHSHVKEQRAQIEEFVDNYEKPVYCLTVSGHVLYVRRNGKPVWCGNCNRYGNKGVIRILPDDEMPMTEDGMVAEVAFSPAGTVSRGNPAQIAELALGKIAMLTGKTYHVSDFDDIDDVIGFANKELEKHGISPDSPVIDRKTGRRILNGDGSGIANGSMWIMKLHHTSESKGSARGIGGYSADESPAKGGETGAKRMAPMHLNALVAHGAYNTFLDAKYARGQSNDDFWIQYMRGITPQMRKTPLVYEKFENSLKASGINVKPDEGRLHVLAMTTKDVEQLAGNREINSGETLRWEKDKSPIKGGLFDPTIFGMNGDRWGKMTPIVPILNPVMEEPARILLGLKQKEIKDVMSGRQDYSTYGSGFGAIEKALAGINVPRAISAYREKMKHGNAGERDHAVRALGYLKACEQTGLHPKDWMLSSIPIIPPKFRPVSEMQGSKVPLIDDANYLYKLMVDTNNSLKELRKYTKNTKEDEYGLYNTYQQVVGLADPTHPKLVQREVRGLLRSVFGVGSSKFSMVQRNLLGTPTDTVARGVIVPDPDLDMDHVGIPEEKAWETYRPHVIHRMTKRGIPWALASKMVEERNEVARDALLQEMEVRPVILDRAPVLHKWGVLAQKPKLVAGDAIRANQFTNKGYGNDFDGDAMNFHVPASEEAVKEAYEFLLPSKSLLQSADMKSAMPRIISENAGGLFLASLPPNKKEKTRTFVSWEEAEKAYRRGDLAIDDPVVVLSSNPLPKK